jgi:hypothetical protein
MPQEKGEEIEDQRLHLDLVPGETEAARVFVQLELTETIDRHGQRLLAAALSKRSEEHKAGVRTPGRLFLSISVCLAGKVIGKPRATRNLEGETENGPRCHPPAQ